MYDGFAEKYVGEAGLSRSGAGGDSGGRMADALALRAKCQRGDPVRRCRAVRSEVVSINRGCEAAAFATAAAMDTNGRELAQDRGRVGDDRALGLEIERPLAEEVNTHVCGFSS